MNKRNFNEESIDKILIIGVGATVFGIFMAMVFQSVYDFIEKPSEGFTLKTSMTFQGGLIGGVSSFLIVWNLYVFVIAPRVKKVKLLQNHMNAGLTYALPFIPIGITIAHAFGRLGCTFAGCCHGRTTDAWYGLTMYASSLGLTVKVVPTQLFECVFLFVLSAVMAVLYFKFKFNANFGLYAVAYGIWRFGIEFARGDHRGSLVSGITPSQFWSLIMVAIGIAYFFVYKFVFKRLMKHPEEQAPIRAEKATKASAEA
jgi:phosphatidylglycerol:prolipoprotein diacylglycerol transferase